MSIKLAWITDLHLDFLEKKDPGALKRLRAALDREGATIVLLGGDIADSRTFEDGLKRFAESCGRPLYYVLGNHDYYFGSVADVRGRAAALEIPGVYWLPRVGIVELDEETALLGHGGWGDAHRGDLADFVILTDYAAISDLAATIEREDFWVNGFKKRKALVTKLQRLGEEAAEKLCPWLETALETYHRLLIFTHVTPFRETCTYKDRPGTDKGFPGFLWDTMGGILKDAASLYPETEFLVFSGHTHQDSQGQVAPNIRAWSASAEYGEIRYRIIVRSVEIGSESGPEAWSVGPSVRV